MSNRNDQHQRVAAGASTLWNTPADAGDAAQALNALANAQFDAAALDAARDGERDRLRAFCTPVSEQSLSTVVD